MVEISNELSNYHAAAAAAAKYGSLPLEWKPRHRVGLHAAVALLLLHWHTSAPPSMPAQTVTMIDLAPLPTPPQPVVQPQPQPVEPPPPLIKPEVKPV